MTAPPGVRRWREDSLSLFLALSALLLGVMYYLEQVQTDALESAAATAQSLSAGALDFDGCLVTSAETDGRTLHVRCSSLTASEAAQRVGSAGGLTAPFDSLVVSGTDARWRCEGPAAGWPDSCTETRRP